MRRWIEDAGAKRDSENSGCATNASTNSRGTTNAFESSGCMTRAFANSGCMTSAFTNSGCARSAGDVSGSPRIARYALGGSIDTRLPESPMCRVIGIDASACSVSSTGGATSARTEFRRVSSLRFFAKRGLRLAFLLEKID